MEIKTQNTAIRRNKPSRPTKFLALETLYLPLYSPVLDYGCGRGDDIEWLTNEHHCNTAGYDPHYEKYSEKLAYDVNFQVVLCNYVLGVLPKITERQDVLRNAWHHVAFGGILAVSVRNKKAIQLAKTSKWESYSDGWITSKSRQTFQHGHTESELFSYVDELAEVRSANIIIKPEYLTVVVQKNFFATGFARLPRIPQTSFWI